MTEPANDSRQSSVIQNLAGIAAAAAIVTALTSALYARVALTDAGPDKTPMPVQVGVFTTQASYQRPVSYLGLVRAAEKANLGFERAGKLEAVLVREGAQVSAGQVLARLSTEQLRSERTAAAARLDQARSELELAKLNARRQADLRKTGAVSKEVFDETRLRAEALASQVAAVTAQLHSIDIQLAKSELLAPFDGAIAQRHVDPGTVVAAGTPVVGLVGDSKREAHIGIGVAQLHTLQLGQHYTLKLRDQSIAATLRSTRPDIDPLTRSSSAVFDLPETVQVLDGEAITLELNETVTIAGGWLPIAALLEGQRGVWNVMAVVPSPGGFTTEREVVEILATQGNRAYVRGTLASGQRVITDGNHRVAAGTAVSPVE